ncbi:hypothetical protein NOCARDAX2BIS_330028 [Nocardioides sp. AX2bis]|nr:hypothetical protein NOCARDAX2BIS_330028 [Nocardioides sp. AX2bis]
MVLTHVLTPSPSMSAMSQGWGVREHRRPFLESARRAVDGSAVSVLPLGLSAAMLLLV